MEHVVPVYDIQESVYLLSKDLVSSSEDLLNYRKSSFAEALADVVAEIMVGLDDYFTKEFVKVLSPVQDLRFRNRLYSHLSEMYGDTPKPSLKKKSGIRSFLFVILAILVVIIVL